MTKAVVCTGFYEEVARTHLEILGTTLHILRLIYHRFIYPRIPTSSDQLPNTIYLAFFTYILEKLLKIHQI